MAAKVNFLLDDEVQASLQDLIPAADRSRFANEALRSQLVLLRRQKAVEALEALRQVGPHVSTEEIVATLRAVREG